MQHFFPFSDAKKSSKHLDGKRLNKQRLETFQCLNTICGFSKGWENHPAIKSYKKYIPFLIKYLYIIEEECIKRGFKQSKNFNDYNKFNNYCQQNNLIYEVPPFIDEEFCSLHKGRLKCKGFIDALCTDIKKQLKIKNLDNWLKARYGKDKNQMRYDDGLKLQADFPQVNFITPNFYEQYGWKDDIRADYVWPV